MSPQLDSGDALEQDVLWAEQGDRAVLVAGRRGVPISSIHAAEDLAMGNGVPWEDGNAEEWGLPAPSNWPGQPGCPGRSWSG